MLIQQRTGPPEQIVFTFTLGEDLGKVFNRSPKATRPYDLVKPFYMTTLSITSSNFFGHKVTLNVPSNQTKLVWGSERQPIYF